MLHMPSTRYIEVRFAPQLHANDSFDVPEVLRAVDRHVTYLDGQPLPHLG
jgi:hypothetical protein